MLHRATSSRSFLALASLLLAGLLVLAWWWPNRPQAAALAMPDTRFNSVSFSPFRPGQSPLIHVYPSPEEVDADLAVLAPRTRAIRTYAADEGSADLVALAARHGLRVWQGIWLSGDRARNAREIARGIALANQHPQTIERVIVGNEVLLRRDLPAEDLIAALDKVRQAVRQPVTYADVWEFWRQFPQVARHVDLVTIHLLPYWEDTPTNLDGAIAHIEAVYRRMAALFPDKGIVIGETGWPSRGRWREGAAPGRVAQASFLRRFVALAHRDHFDYNLIEAFDQDWKYQSEGTVGANWGLWTAGRAPKFPLSGPVVEDPKWPWHAAASILAGLVLTYGPGRDRRLGTGGRIGLAVLGMVFGGALGFAWAGTVPLAYDRHLALAALVNLPGQAILAMLMMRRAASILAGATPPPARTGADATDTVRALLRLRVPERSAGWLFDDLAFVFVWTAAVMQLLLLLDPRYRDFPLQVFAVPLVCVLARALLQDLPRGGGGIEEWAAGGALVIASIAMALREGAANQPAMIWTGAALILAIPPLLRVLSPRRPGLQPSPGAERSSDDTPGRIVVDHRRGADADGGDTDPERRATQRPEAERQRGSSPQIEILQPDQRRARGAD